MNADTPSQNLQAAAQAVLDRWESPKWEWQSHGPTADLMADLRKALAASPQPTAAPATDVAEAVAAERERLRVLVQAVRDANHGAQGEYPFRLLTAQQERAWVALMAALEGTNGPVQRAPA